MILTFTTTKDCISLYNIEQEFNGLGISFVWQHSGFEFLLYIIKNSEEWYFDSYTYFFTWTLCFLSPPLGYSASVIGMSTSWDPHSTYLMKIPEQLHNRHLSTTPSTTIPSHSSLCRHLLTPQNYRSTLTTPPPRNVGWIAAVVTCRPERDINTLIIVSRVWVSYT